MKKEYVIEYVPKCGSRTVQVAGFESLEGAKTYANVSGLAGRYCVIERLTLESVAFCDSKEKPDVAGTADTTVCFHVLVGDADSFLLPGFPNGFKSLESANAVFSRSSFAGCPYRIVRHVISVNKTIVLDRSQEQ